MGWRADVLKGQFHLDLIEIVQPFPSPNTFLSQELYKRSICDVIVLFQIFFPKLKPRVIQNIREDGLNVMLCPTNPISYGSRFIFPLSRPTRAQGGGSVGQGLRYEEGGKMKRITFVVNFPLCKEQGAARAKQRQLSLVRRRNRDPHLSCLKCLQKATRFRQHPLRKENVLLLSLTAAVTLS